MLKTFLKAGLTVGILALLLWRVDWSILKNSLSKTSLPLFALSTLGLFILFVLPATAQNRLFSGCSLRIRVLRIYIINIISMFYSLIFPGDVASATARFIKFTRSHEGPVSEGAPLQSSILVVMALDRFLNMTALLLPIPFLLFFIYSPPHTVWLQKISALALVGSSAIMFCAYRLPHQQIADWLSKIRLSLLSKLLLNVTDAFQELPKKTVMGAFLILLLYQTLCVVIVDWTLAQSLGLNVPFFYFVSIAMVIRFARLLPITISGIGLREGLFPFFLKIFDIPFETAVTLGLLGTAQVLIAGIVGGLVEGGQIHFSIDGRRD